MYSINMTINNQKKDKPLTLEELLNQPGERDRKVVQRYWQNWKKPVEKRQRAHTH